MVQWVIAEVMADNEVDPNAVIPRFRRHSVYGWGTFKCPECRISWTSQITWVTLDIKDQRIRRRFKQKCKKCGQLQRPWWHVEEFAYMMRFALDRYKKLVDGTWQPSSRSNARPESAKIPPHKSELCERCGFGERKCWAAQTEANADSVDSKTTIEKAKSVSGSLNESGGSSLKSEEEKSSPQKDDEKAKKSDEDEGLESDSGNSVSKIEATADAVDVDNEGGPDDINPEEKKEEKEKIAEVAAKPDSEKEQSSGDAQIGVQKTERLVVGDEISETQISKEDNKEDLSVKDKADEDVMNAAGEGTRNLEDDNSIKAPTAAGNGKVMVANSKGGGNQKRSGNAKRLPGSPKKGTAPPAKVSAGSPKSVSKSPKGDGIA